jgi:hypothetical protein
MEEESEKWMMEIHSDSKSFSLNIIIFFHSYQYNFLGDLQIQRRTEQMRQIHLLLTINKQLKFVDDRISEINEAKLQRSPEHSDKEDEDFELVEGIFTISLQIFPHPNSHLPINPICIKYIPKLSIYP